jgi:hypothetical protein
MGQLLSPVKPGLSTSTACGAAAGVMDVFFVLSAPNSRLRQLKLSWWTNRISRIRQLLSPTKPGLSTHSACVAAAWASTCVSWGVRTKQQAVTAWAELVENAALGFFHAKGSAARRGGGVRKAFQGLPRSARSGGATFSSIHRLAYSGKALVDSLGVGGECSPYTQEWGACSPSAPELCTSVVQ